MTPLPKRGFGPPSYGTFSTPLTCQCSVFPVQKSTTEQTRSSFGGVQKFSGERVLWYAFLPPYVLHPAISRPNGYPVGQKRPLDVVAGQKLHGTIFVSQLSRNCPHHGGNLERRKNVLSCGRKTVWEAF